VDTTSAPPVPASFAAASSPVLREPVALAAVGCGSRGPAVWRSGCNPRVSNPELGRTHHDLHKRETNTSIFVLADLPTISLKLLAAVVGHPRARRRFHYGVISPHALADVQAGLRTALSSAHRPPRGSECSERYCASRDGVKGLLRLPPLRCRWDRENIIRGE